MTDEELGFLPATELVPMVRQKKISPVEVIATILKRIERLEPRLNAMTYIAAERAMDAARNAETALMRGATKPLAALLPESVGKSLVQVRSLIVTGTPCSGPRVAPRISAVSALRAASIARSAAM